MKIVITTQYMENYGAHDWDGKGQCPQYWKSKGGQSYVVENLTPEEVSKFEDMHMEKIMPLIQYSNAHTNEFVIGYNSHEDNAVVCDFWETQKVISVVDGQYAVSAITKNDEYSFMHKSIVEKRESYVMLPEGEREQYSVVYLLKNGMLVDSKEVAKYLQ